MDALFTDFATAQNHSQGYLLASTISPTPPPHDPSRLHAFLSSTNTYSLETDLRYKLQYNPDISPKLHPEEASAWSEVFKAFYKFVSVLLPAEDGEGIGDWASVYESWKEVVRVLLRGYTGNVFDAWTIPCLYTAAKYLKDFAIKADESSASQRDSGVLVPGSEALGQEEDAFGNGGKNEKLENAAAEINKLFSACLTDRSPLADSRKWALYPLTNTLFALYFRLHSHSLCHHILRTLATYTARNDLPPLNLFPKAHQITFLYYTGALRFLDEDYVAAETNLEEAWRMCPRESEGGRNMEMILSYLIPTKLITKHVLPSKGLLAGYPRLAELYTPLCAALRRADLRALDVALAEGGTVFIHKRVYLTLERSRDIAIRNLFRKVFLAGGFEAGKEGLAPVRRTRVPLEEFGLALKMMGGDVGDGEDGEVDGEEVECLIANLIYKNLMKGYIAREHGKVVLAKNGAFPGTGV
ncbi:hypothetical protein B0A48_12430 [Cryoendolithus antarcticus]|uniref:Protein CSN12 homolog n=1 Tax=Cryoendolithus antarcticus TaxID=1507870 RepID=A0A1V8SRZ6_9PEZI|nr:hypothetical protein B0A48_12430 [Cryoendolithus antarcticus]